jgi:hypothetical protein
MIRGSLPVHAHELRVRTLKNVCIAHVIFDLSVKLAISHTLTGADTDHNRTLKTP